MMRRPQPLADRRQATGGPDYFSSLPSMAAMAALNWLAQAHHAIDPEAAVLNEREFVALAERLLT